MWEKKRTKPKFRIQADTVFEPKIQVFKVKILLRAVLSSAFLKNENVLLKYCFNINLILNHLI